MPEDRIKQLRCKLRRPREVFAAHLDQAIKVATGGDLIDILAGIRRALDTRAPTPRERALVDALLLQVQTGGQRPTICTCIRCGVTASLVATVLVGFACCGSCWSYLNTLHGSLELIKLDIDLPINLDLDMSIVTIGSLDGVEL